MWPAPGRKTVIGILLLSAVALAGCDKEVKLSFVNTTSQSRDLQLTVPGHGTSYLGVLGPTGGRITHKLKINEDYLPATCSWEAGGRSGSFTINTESKSKLLIAIDPTGNIGPIDKGTTVHKADKIEVEEVVIEQDTVVE